MLDYKPNPLGLCGDFFEMFPGPADSLTANDHFEVSSGTHLLITDIEWSVYAPPPDQESSVRFYLCVVNSDLSRYARVFGAPDQSISPGLVSYTSGNAYLTTGILVGPGMRLCPLVVPNGPWGSALPSVVEARLRGYLTNAPHPTPGSNDFDGQ
jgi:hypothetical protein